MPIQTPYDPESVIEDFGWLWLTDGPMGPEWQLVQTIEDGLDGPLMTWFVGYVDGHTSDCYPAHYYRGKPYMPCSAPTAEPGRSDALEVSIRLPDGASVAHSFGDAAAAETVQKAVFAALALGRQS